jgi:hypothetical protein
VKKYSIKEAQFAILFLASHETKRIPSLSFPQDVECVTLWRTENVPGPDRRQLAKGVGCDPLNSDVRWEVSPEHVQCYPRICTHDSFHIS